MDKMIGRLMNKPSTGNGMRESYAHIPMPRMTNTYMLNGKDKFEDMISSVDDGIYAKNFDGGQVDITSGKFVFCCASALKFSICAESERKPETKVYGTKENKGTRSICTESMERSSIFCVSNSVEIRKAPS